MTPQYILEKSLCRPPHCADKASIEKRAQYIEYMRFADGYSEPGYTEPKKCVLFTNWNYFCSEVTDILERYGYAPEWEDEWSECEKCNKAVRNSPDSYSWQPSYAILHGCEIVCADCLVEDAAEYLESLENKPSTALNIPAIDPADYGYVKLAGDFENGWHPHQNDDPKTIYNWLKANNSRLLFQIDSVGQFALGFSIWSHPKE
jgi:hypothetical protein